MTPTTGVKRWVPSAPCPEPRAAGALPLPVRPSQAVLAPARPTSKPATCELCEFETSQFQLPGIAPLPFGIRLSYNVQEASDSPFGYGWTFNTNQKLTENADGSATLLKQMGNYRTYPKESGNFNPPAGVNNTLIKNQDGTWRETQKNGRIYDYATTGKLSKMLDKNSNAWTMTYDAGGKLTKLTDPLNRVTTYAYTAQNRVRSGGP